MPGYQLNTTIYVIANNEDDAVNIVEDLLSQPLDNDELDLDFMIDDVHLDYSVSSSLEESEE